MLKHAWLFTGLLLSALACTLPLGGDGAKDPVVAPGEYPDSFTVTFRYIPESSLPPLQTLVLRLEDWTSGAVQLKDMRESQGIWTFSGDLKTLGSTSVESVGESADGSLIRLQAGLSFLFTASGQDVVELRPRDNLPLNPVLVLGDSHLYAIGGMESQGVPSRKVFRAALGEQGTLGPWQEDTPLPEPWFGGVGYSLGGWVHVAGGSVEGGWMAPAAADGSLGFSTSTGGKWEASRTRLPESRSGGGIRVVGDRIIWTGGTLSSGLPAPPWIARQWKDGQVSPWYRGLPVPVTGEADPYIPLGAGFVTVGSEGQLEYYFNFQKQQAPLPRIFPGAGIISTKTKLRADILPGDVLRFTRAVGRVPPEPDENSEVFSPLVPPQPTEGEIFLWKTFRGGSDPSQTLRTAWKVESSSLFVLLAGSLQPSQDPLQARNLMLEEIYSDGSSQPVTAVTYGLKLLTETELEFLWTGQNIPVNMTVLEEDLQQPALDLEAQPILDRQSGGAVSARLPAGKYYVRLSRNDGLTGGALTLSCVEK